jgi:hypothetical protein
VRIEIAEGEHAAIRALGPLQLGEREAQVGEALVCGEMGGGRIRRFAWMPACAGMAMLEIVRVRMIFGVCAGVGLAGPLIGERKFLEDALACRRLRETDDGKCRPLALGFPPPLSPPRKG